MSTLWTSREHITKYECLYYKIYISGEENANNYVELNHLSDKIRKINFIKM